MRTFLPLLLLLAAAAPAPAQDDVTIYRCTDADGRLALQDFPCADDEQQQVRIMTRPQDPPPRPAPAPSAAASPAPEPPAVEFVVRQPPRPMYECITPDGERYTSDSGEGNPRPAPAWNWGGGHWTGPAPGVPPGPSGSAQRRAVGIASPGMSTSPGPSLTAPARGRAAPPPPASRPHPRHRPVWGYPAGGGWIRDECHPLPQSRVCELLTQRRGEIGRRIFNAQPSERAALREEQRDINARLAQDCGRR